MSDDYLALARDTLRVCRERRMSDGGLPIGGLEALATGLLSRLEAAEVERDQWRDDFVAAAKDHVAARASVAAVEHERDALRARIARVEALVEELDKWPSAKNHDQAVASGAVGAIVRQLARAALDADAEKDPT